MKSMIFLSLLTVFTFLFFAACTRNKTITLPLTIIEIKVKHGNSWSTSNTELTIVSGATIKIYNTPADAINHLAPRYMATTNYLGIAAIPVDYRSKYFFTVEKGNAKNIMNGLLITGIFDSQAAIDTSPVQLPTPLPGSPKFLDANGDGIITIPDDIIHVDYIDIIQHHKTTKTAIVYQ